eukprot:TRINITY_DN16711_c0_g1_i2.p2 TRINITY_DN16711_c0_g1~~TRINITY_DN16711_c0_g1_i2.p2  ORF type:complete len:350 (+),score=126.27 TRINITY_DN16711_c0_g1_i2:652-1701(+)
MRDPDYSPINVSGHLRKAAALYHRLHPLVAELAGSLPPMALYGLLDSHQGIDGGSKILHGGDVRKQAAAFARRWLPVFVYHELFALLVTPEGVPTELGLRAAAPHCLHHVKAAEVKRALSDACAKLDAAYLGVARDNRWYDGTSCLAVLVIANIMHIVSIGDSKCMLCKQKPGGELAAHVVSGKEHRLRQKAEAERVTKAGGAVRDLLVGGAVAVTRSIGDPELKRGGKGPLICTPELFSYAVTPGEDLFLLLAQGRFWDVRQRQELAVFVHQRVSAEILDVALPDLDTARERERGGAPPPYDMPCGLHNLPRAVRDLAREAGRQRLGLGASDTLSVLAICIEPFGVTV